MLHSQSDVKERVIIYANIIHIHYNYSDDFNGPEAKWIKYEDAGWIFKEKRGEEEEGGNVEYPMPI